MVFTILGSGDSVGQPAPLCDCDFCANGPKRRRPSLAFYNEKTKLVFDIGPDIIEQLEFINGDDTDYFFTTHAHYDHLYGLDELNHTVVPNAELEINAFEDSNYPLDIRLCASSSVLEFIEDNFPHTIDSVQFEEFSIGSTRRINDIRIKSFPVEHSSPEFVTNGFLIDSGSISVAYAPDAGSFSLDEDVDYLITDALTLLYDGLHGESEQLLNDIRGLDPDKTILVNVSEHLFRRETDQIEDMLPEGMILGSDFMTFGD